MNINVSSENNGVINGNSMAAWAKYNAAKYISYNG
jgi:hypothetical protein